MSQQQFEYEVMSQFEVMQYTEFLLSNATKPICNGDTLIQAIEDGYLYEEFRDSIIYKE
jgi:hypothetical protein